MTLFSLPSLVFAWYGSRIPQEEQDAIGLYRFTLGNIGYNTRSPTYATDSACSDPAYQNTSDTCIRIMNNYEFVLVNAASILTACEIIQICIFFCTIYHLSRLIGTFEEKMGRLITSVTDYSVMVSGIPKDSTVAQVITHFSNLYALDKPDWANRRGLEGARPVQHVRDFLFACYCIVLYCTVLYCVVLLIVQVVIFSVVVIVIVSRIAIFSC